MPIIKGTLCSSLYRLIAEVCFPLASAEFVCLLRAVNRLSARKSVIARLPVIAAR